MIKTANIPNYPTFRVLDLKSYNILYTYLSKYSEYSDLTFLSLYAWNTDKNTQFTFLNNNLVLKMSDYNIQHRKNCILVGVNKLENTLNILFEKRKKLVLLPNEIIEQIEKLNSNSFLIEEDIDNFDYVYSTEALANLNGKKYKSLRQNINQFKNSYISEHCIIDLNDIDIRRQVIENIGKWKETKVKNYNHKEVLAIKRAFKYNKHGDFLNVGVFINNKLIGFTINEIINNEMATGHFGKYNPEYKGISKYLEHITAYYLLKKGIKSLNLEQDLGIEGIRNSKKSLRPIGMIKKYTLSKII